MPTARAQQGERKENAKAMHTTFYKNFTILPLSPLDFSSTLRYNKL